MRRDAIKFDAGESPSRLTVFMLALTHVLLIFDAVIFIPNLLGKTVGLAPDALQYVTFASLLVSALFTFLQSRARFGVGSGFILFCGSYSAFMLCSLDAVRMGGLPLLASMSLLTLPVIFLYSYFIRFFRHVITPAVGGVVILLIATSMVPIGLELWTGPQDLGAADSAARLLVGGVTALVLVVSMLFGSTGLKLWGPVLAMACGYGAAMATGQLHFVNAARSPFFGLPSPAAWPGLELRLGAAHLPLFLAFAMAMIASMIESTGNIMLVQQISTRDFRRVSYDRVQGGLYCDGLSKLAAALLGTAVPSTYCDNLPLIEMTGVASRKIGACGAGLLLALAFMPKVSGVILDMPSPVIGGVLLVVCAMLFHAGFGLVAMTRLGNQHGLILGLSLSVGLVAQNGSFFPQMLPAALEPLLRNSVAVGGFTAFFLSALAHLAPKRGVSGTFRAHTEALPAMKALLEKGRGRLKLSPGRFNELALCCEEMFCHMAETGGGDPGRTVTLRASKTEEGCFVEMVCGHRMDDINNFAVPESFLEARPDDLRQLGLILFAGYARDAKHIEISGYSYVSFLI